MKKKETELEEKVEELAEVQEKLTFMTKRNTEIKIKLDQQFLNFQKICEETMGRYKIFDDLVKRDKI